MEYPAVRSVSDLFSVGVSEYLHVFTVVFTVYSVYFAVLSTVNWQGDVMYRNDM